MNNRLSSTILRCVIRFIEYLINWFEDIFRPPLAPNGEGLPVLKTHRLNQRIQNNLRQFFLVLRRRRGHVYRALICWIIGLLALHLDEVDNYDFRLALRGDQDASQEIVLIDITPKDLSELYPNPNLYRDSKEPGPPRPQSGTDAKYWNLKVWRELITKVLVYQPKILGVNFFFDIHTDHPLELSDWNLFNNESVIWMGSMTQGSRPLLPPFSTPEKKNFGYFEFQVDEDGLTRSVQAMNPMHPPFVLKLAEKNGNVSPDEYPSVKTMINFRGARNSFKHLTLTDLFQANFSSDLLKDKIIIIGSSFSPNSSIATPVGLLSRSEILAHLTDNLIHNRWIHRIPKTLAISELFFVMLLSVFLMTFYPQKVAFVFLTLFGLLLSTLSIWFFDTFNFWTPTFSPLLVIFGTWSLFVGYLASRMELRNWQLQQERKSLAELEQLKNNFVSLISHDFKTPIAKIQAIVDRLLLIEHSDEMTQDLKSLRGCSQELHRYIQSILKILRVESKDFHLNLEATDINLLVDQALNQLRPLALEKELSLTESLEPLFNIEVDPTLIQEVLVNIFENAIKYTPKGGAVLIKTFEEKNNIIIQVTDNGEGIRSEDIENIFGKFVRGKDQDMKSKGTGLGLYLVKYFVELHGGQVNLTSQFGKGTTVELFLPLELI